MNTKYFYFDLNFLSKYRTQLMGLAAIMIIFCHAPNYGVEMPSALSKVIGRGGLGVDIFLLLSGIGCYYSLSKGGNKRDWYKKRFIRIFIPYALIQIPFWIYRLFVGEFDFIDELIIFSTLDFWLHHVGAWYVALLLPLYILTPPIYIFLRNDRHKFVRAAILILLLLILCSIRINVDSAILENVLNNLQWAFVRVISFIIGMSLAPYVKNSFKINIIIVFASALCLYIGVHQFIDKDIFMNWCLVWPTVVIFSLFVECLSTDRSTFKFLSWMGLVSLESYLANIYLCATVKDMTMRIGQFSILTGHYVEYICVMVFGMGISYVVNVASKAFIKDTSFQRKPEHKSLTKEI